MRLGTADRRLPVAIAQYASTWLHGRGSGRWQCPASVYTGPRAAEDDCDFIHASVFDSNSDKSASSNRPASAQTQSRQTKNLTMASFLASSGTTLQGQRLCASRRQQCAARRSAAVTASHRVDKFSKNDVIVSPSILSANFSKLGEQARSLANQRV